jgi:hypothetical protein
MEYTKLENYLKAGKWREADNETARVMLAIANREREGCLVQEDIDNFPYADLYTINQLWVKYSYGKFGFSVQKQIYQSLGGTKEYNREIWCQFAEKVGWRNGEWLYYSSINFDIEAFLGHLPAFWIEWMNRMMVRCRFSHPEAPAEVFGDWVRLLLSRQDL